MKTLLLVLIALLLPVSNYAMTPGPQVDYVAYVDDLTKTPGISDKTVIKILLERNYEASLILRRGDYVIVHYKALNSNNTKVIWYREAEETKDDARPQKRIRQD